MARVVVCPRGFGTTLLVVVVMISWWSLFGVALGDSCVPMPASLASQCQVYVHIRLSSRLSSQRALSLCLSVCRVITLTHGRLSSRVIGVGTPVLVPDGLTIDDLDNAAAADVGVFLVGLSSTQCTDAGVAFVCAQYFHSCVPVALPDGSSGAWCSWFVVARFEFDALSRRATARRLSRAVLTHTTAMAMHLVDV